MVLVFSLSSCGDESEDDAFTSPVLTATDSQNDRLFVLENDGVLFIRTASTRNAIGDTPFVNDETNEDIFALLPSAPTHMVALDLGSSTTRLFIMGAQLDLSDDLVTNQVLVLDFDGTTLSQTISAFSVGDSTNASDRFEGMVADDSTDTIYIVNSTTGEVTAFDETGTELTSATLEGFPNQISLTDGRLYISNSEENGSSENILSVINTSDFTDVETISLGVPTDRVAALSTSLGIVLLAKQADSQVVFIRLIDSSGFDANPATELTTTAIAFDNTVDNDADTDGEINADAGLSSAVTDLVLATDSTGAVFGYALESDGNLEKLAFASDLTSFVAEQLSSVGEVLVGPSVFEDDDGTQIIHMCASATGELISTEVGSDSIGAKY